eukprot:3838353-Prymnesium_polylepis.1
MRGEDGGRYIVAVAILARRSTPAVGGAVREAINQAKRLLARRRVLLPQVALRRLGQPCASQAPMDKGVADCELSWCGNKTDHCQFCKCRGCATCESLRLPSWATSNPKAVQAACDKFGVGICNATGNLSATMERVWQRWNWNHTSAWIDEIFSTTYRNVTATFRAQTVAADDGLDQSEWEAMQRAA